MQSNSGAEVVALNVGHFVRSRRGAYVPRFHRYGAFAQYNNLQSLELYANRSRQGFPPRHVAGSRYFTGNAMS